MTAYAQLPPSPFFSPPAGVRDGLDHEAIGAVAFVMALRARGIRDTAVLGAMERVPRDLFAPTRFTDLARSDVALPLPCGQTMTAPGTVATMLVALGLKAGQRVLEIGTGSGYVTALLAKLGGRVQSLERYASLADSAASRLALAGVGDEVALALGDGLRPDVGQARFDRILVNGAVAALPPALTSCLAPGGRLIGALSIDGLPRLVRVERSSEGKLAQELGASLRLAPLAAGRAASL